MFVEVPRPYNEGGTEEILAKERFDVEKGRAVAPASQRPALAARYLYALRDSKRLVQKRRVSEIRGTVATRDPAAGDDSGERA